ncbi:hypothetical protein M427DRAFT_46995 [Gonapodya prolifera JEL478]|uniref:Uncharacterized protein n=1 Tax=Gonapodya prolifera (strain JEL478) TaxID=1344416 RepID=A0A139A4S5_GONPJ|nr:hypothetical protein M427DRAFT_46995 [Gonapodya prolifera JEL478]|eukprot:KXS11618.1 hypothetical protein M427DRAFT_46995 [Gonapodya prolifera JEL478]
MSAPAEQFSLGPEHPTRSPSHPFLFSPGVSPAKTHPSYPKFHINPVWLCSWPFRRLRHVGFAGGRKYEVVVGADVKRPVHCCPSFDSGYPNRNLVDLNSQQKVDFKTEECPALTNPWLPCTAPNSTVLPCTPHKLLVGLFEGVTRPEVGGIGALGFSLAKETLPKNEISNVALRLVASVPSVIPVGWLVGMTRPEFRGIGTPGFRFVKNPNSDDNVSDAVHEWAAPNPNIISAYTIKNHAGSVSRGDDGNSSGGSEVEFLPCSTFTTSTEVRRGRRGRVCAMGGRPGQWCEGPGRGVAKGEDVDGEFGGEESDMAKSRAEG